MKVCYSSIRHYVLLVMVAACFLSGAMVASGQTDSPSAQKPREVAHPKEPLSLDNVFKALRSDKAKPAVKNQLLIQGVKLRGVAFELTAEIEEELTAQGANKALIEAIRKESDGLRQSGYYYRERGDDSRLRKNYAEALTNYGKAIEINPSDRASYNNRGQVYREMEQYDQAIADFTKVIELDPTDRNGYHNRGVIYYQQRDYQKAIEDFTRAISIDPNFTTAYQNRANSFQMIGQLESAEADRRQAKNLKP